MTRALLAQRHPRAATEAGFALPTAIIVLLVITLLTGAAITVATQSSTSTTRDNNVKAEIEAAEAGLHVAGYRLTQLSPLETQCVNGSEAVEPATSPCNSGSESLGNGATFKYWTTLPLTAGEKCGGRTVEALATSIQRCDTSEGTVNSVQPAVRLQVRVTAARLFPVNGLVGLESVEIANGAQIKAKGGTNGKFLVKNGASVEGVVLGKSAPPSQPEGGGSWGTVTRESTDLTLVAVNPGTSATENSNYRIENGLKSPKVEPYDESAGVTYNKETRTLEVGNGGKLTLGGGIYNFCNFTVANNAEILLTKGVTTKIYIDSPSDLGSGCKAAGDGKFTVSNNSNIVNPSKEANKFQVYVYDGSGGPVLISNNVTFYGTIYAPGSTVNVKNNAETVGAIAGKVVNLKNNITFGSDKNVEALLAEPYHRATWEQCTQGSGATEGC